VMMCVGQQFVVACVDSITDKKEKANFLKNIHQSKRSLIEISHQQMNSFAGNMIQVSSQTDEPFLLMSESAHESLTPEQLTTLTSLSRVAWFDIETIETCGGGSVRCMIAEIF